MSKPFDLNTNEVSTKIITKEPNDSPRNDDISPSFLHAAISAGENPIIAEFLKENTELLVALIKFKKTQKEPNHLYLSLRLELEKKISNCLLEFGKKETSDVTKILIEIFSHYLI